MLQYSSAYPTLRRYKILEKPELIHFNKNIDDRGFFVTPFSNADVNRLNIREVYISLSFTHLASTVRGMHFQTSPFSEAKLLTVLRGSIHDVVIDVNQSLPKKNRIFQFKLTDTDNFCLYIPRGFAHGYQTQTDDVLMMYALDSRYSKLNTRGFSPLSKNLLNLWPMPPRNIKKEDLAWPEYV